MFTLAISWLSTSSLLGFMVLTVQIPINIVLYSIRLYFHHQTHPQLGCFPFCSASSFLLKLFLHSSTVAYWTPADLGAHLSVSHLFAFSYCLWGSQGKNAEVICYSLLQWIHNEQQVIFWQRRFPAFPTILCLLAGNRSLKMCGFLSILRFFGLPLDPHCLQYKWFPLIWPCLHFSAHS